MPGRFELYRDAAGQYRWRLWSSNRSDIIADSAEGYTSKAGAQNGIQAVKTDAPAAPIDDKT